jgi:hypothetical protein
LDFSFDASKGNTKESKGQKFPQDKRFEKDNVRAQTLMTATSNKQFSTRLPYLRQTFMVLECIKKKSDKSVSMGRIPKALNTWNHTKYHQIWVISGERQAFCLRANSQMGNTKQQHLPSFRQILKF